MSVHRPRMVYSVKGKVAVDGETVTENEVALPSWRLMPKQMATELNAVAYAVTKYIGTVSVGFKASRTGDEKEVGVPGLFIVPRPRVSEVLDELEKFEEKLLAVVRTHASDPDAFIAAIKAKVGEKVFAKLGDKFKEKVTLRKLLKATGIRTMSMPVQTDLESVQAVNTGILDARLQSETQRAIAAIVDNIVAQPRQEMAEALKHLGDMLAGEDGTLTPRSVGAVATAFEKLRAFDFVLTDDMRGRVTQLETELNAFAARPVENRRGANAAPMAEAINRLREELSNVHNVAEHVEFLGRRIRTAESPHVPQTQTA